jgi:folate-binding protein YgfZ
VPHILKKIYVPLGNRALLALSGVDVRPFLQGIVTNDINKLDSEKGIYALMLTPQGKFLYDFFIYDYQRCLFLDCSTDKLLEIQKKLSMYKLRSQVDIKDISSEYEVVVIQGEPLFASSAASIYPDPRSAALPMRAIVAKSDNYQLFRDGGFVAGNIADLERERISLCIPSDMDMEDGFPLEYEMDRHNAIDYKKGCYVGQEVTARIHYRGVLRKKPFLVTSAQQVDLSSYKGQEVISGGNKIGIMCSAIGNVGIALLKMDDLNKAGGKIEVGGVGLEVAEL